MRADLLRTFWKIANNGQFPIAKQLAIGSGIRPVSKIANVLSYPRKLKKPVELDKF